MFNFNILLLPALTTSVNATVSIQGLLLQKALVHSSRHIGSRIDISNHALYDGNAGACYLLNVCIFDTNIALQAKPSRFKGKIGIQNRKSMHQYIFLFPEQCTGSGIKPDADFVRIFMILCLVPFGWSSLTNPNRPNTFNVVKYGAVGDGKTDDSQAFLKAWEAACKAKFPVAIVLVPRNRTFLLKPVQFEGPCNSIRFAVRGNLIAPEKDIWSKEEKEGDWIRFASVTGLRVNGRGQLDGRGDAWWSCKPCPRPTVLRFNKCDGLKLSGITSINPPKNHISVSQSNNVTVFNLNIVAPWDSTNTDGIDISSSRNVTVQDSFIGTGDDCIAINNATFQINIINVQCGPGHGISVGSLGKNGGYAAVEDIHVKNCSFTNTTNGARIKTWQGGKGYARRIKFEQISLTSVENPIIIDQYYCDSDHPCKNQTSNVAISGVSYLGVHGSSATDLAISLNCSVSNPCTNIYMDDINIQSMDQGVKTLAACSNVHGRSLSVTPDVPCL